MLERIRNTRSSSRLVAACCTSLFATSAWGVTVTVPAVQDAMIFGTNANPPADTGNASGKGPSLFAGADSGISKKRSLIEFDIASANIPSNATITGATMTLYLNQVAGSGGGTSGGPDLGTRTVSIYDVLQSWTEGNSQSPTSTSPNGGGQGAARGNNDSTWDYASFNTNSALAVRWNSNPLNGPGDPFPATDLHGGNFSSTASASNSSSGTYAGTSFTNMPFSWSGAGEIADVQAWVSGTQPNYGWLLKSDNLENTAQSFLGFWSKDGAAANNNPAVAGAPALTITYTVPEPASLTVLVFGASGLLLGRRRGR